MASRAAKKECDDYNEGIVHISHKWDEGNYMYRCPGLEDYYQYAYSDNNAYDPDEYDDEEY